MYSKYIQLGKDFCPHSLELGRSGNSPMYRCIIKLNKVQSKLSYPYFVNLFQGIMRTYRKFFIKSFRDEIRKDICAQLGHASLQ